MFTALHSFFTPLHGFLDAVVYGLTTSELVALRKKIANRQSGRVVDEEITPKKGFDRKTVPIIVAFLLLILVRGSLNLVISFATDLAPPVTSCYLQSLTAISSQLCGFVQYHQ